MATQTPIGEPVHKAVGGRKGVSTVEKKNNVLEVLRIEYVPLNSIRPNTYNPNRQSDHEFELLVKSITEDGFTQPIVTQSKSREFVDGEHRWTAAIVVSALKLSGTPYAKWTGDMIREARENRLALLNGPAGEAEVPVVFVDMEPEQMRIATLRHNRARGTEDIELSAQLLRDLRELGALDWAQDSLMLDDVEMQRLLDDVTAPEALASEEFKEAWLPEGGALMDDGERAVGAGGYVTLQGGSLEAVERMRKAEKALASALTEEERQKAIADRQVYRVSLIFTNEEAKLVKAVLGSDPAQRLLELCRKEAG